NGRPPELKIGHVTPKFDNDLQIFSTLLTVVNFDTMMPGLEVTPDYVSVSYHLGLADLAFLSFSLSNLEFHSQVKIPFKGDAPTALIGFGTRARPFTLGVLMFAGAGYIEIGVGSRGTTTFDVSLQFGALLAIAFLIGKAEVHAFGGIACQSQSGGRPAFSA